LQPFENSRVIKAYIKIWSDQDFYCLMLDIYKISHTHCVMVNFLLNRAPKGVLFLALRRKISNQDSLISAGGIADENKSGKTRE
jgi:hypothetical protein|tara:strand:+ start:6208 stop:6459 length:252 start_codon:yes stop_codon:yes gene_type:complete